MSPLDSGEMCIRDSRVGNPDLRGAAFEFFNAGHVRAVNHCRIRIVTALKILRLMLKVLTDQGNLIRSVRILRHDSLHATSLRHLEDVHSPGHIEWHHAV